MVFVSSQLLVASQQESEMQKAIQDFLFGLFFGMGFYVAANLLNFLGQFIHAH